MAKTLIWVTVTWVRTYTKILELCTPYLHSLLTIQHTSIYLKKEYKGSTSIRSKSFRLNTVFIET